MANNDFSQFLKYVEENEAELRSTIGVSKFNVLRDYATIKSNSSIFGDQYAQEDISMLDFLFENSSKISSQEFNAYWNFHRNNAQDELKYAGRAYESGAAALSLDMFDQNETLASSYFYDSEDAEDIWRQKNGIAPKAIDNDIKKIQRTGYDAKQFYTNDEQGAILSSLYWYDENDPEDVLNMLYGRTPKAFKYEKTDEDFTRKQRGEMPLAAETYIANTKRFQAEYAEYAAKMQDYADKKHAYDNRTGLAVIFEAPPEEPYKNEELPETVKALFEWKEKQEKTDVEKNLEGYSFFTETGKPEIKDAEKPHFLFDDSVALLSDEFKPSERVAKLIEYRNEETAKRAAGIPMAPLQDIFMPSPEKVAQQRVEQDYIAELKKTGEYDKITAEQNERTAKIKELVASDYSPENFKYLKENIDWAEELGIVGGEKQARTMTVETLNNVGQSEFMDIAKMGAKAVNIAEVLTGSAGTMAAIDMAASTAYAKDAQMADIRAQLDAAGWKGESQSDNGAIQTLLDKAEYRTLQLQNDIVNAYREVLKEQPSWMVSIISGMKEGAGSFIDSIGTVALEAGKLITIGTFNDSIDPIVQEIAEKSANRDRLALRDVEESKDATDFTKTLYTVAKVGTEMGINIAIGSAIGGVAAEAAAAKGTATALTGWKAVASKLMLKPSLTPIFVTSLGHNLMEGTLEGRTDAEKWLAALPAAYFEAQIEGLFGFMSGRSAPIVQLVKNGSKGATKATLKNVAVSLLDNTFGETLEEIIQDQTGEFFRGVFWKGYEPQYFDLEQMGETAKITMMIGGLLSVVGLPGAIRNVNVARSVETNFNKYAEAYYTGDRAAMEKHMAKLKKDFPKALDLMKQGIADGTLDKIIKYTMADADTRLALEQMDTTARAAMELRAARAAGQDVSQAAINVADAQANQAVQAMEIGTEGRAALPATLYDQIGTNKELTEMVNGGGLSSQLIMQNNAVLTDAQIEALQAIEKAAETNPYVNVTFDEGATAETITPEIRRAQQAYTLSEAKFKRYLNLAKAELTHAYNISVKEGQRMDAEIRAELSGIDADVKRHYKTLTDAKLKLSGYEAQTRFRQQFADSTPVQADNLPPTDFINDAEPQNATEGTSQPTQPQNAQEGAQRTERGQERGAQLFAAYEQQRVFEETVKNAQRTETLRNIMLARENELPASVVDTISRRFDRIAQFYNTAKNPKANMAERHQAIDMLMNELDLRETAVGAIYGQMGVQENEIRPMSLIIGKLQSARYSRDIETANKLATRHLLDGRVLRNDPDIALRAFDNAMDIIRRGEYYIRFETELAPVLAAEVEQNAKPKVVERYEQGGKVDSAAVRGLKTFADNMLGSGAMNADQYALTLSGNNAESALYNLLYRDVDKAQNYHMWMALSDSDLFRGFFGREDIKKFMKVFEKQQAYTVQLESGDTINNMTLNDIAWVYDNFLAGNDLSVGVQFSSDQRVKEISYADAEMISSILTGENRTPEAEKIAQQIGQQKLGMTKEIADFAYNYFNNYSFVNQNGETVPGPKARANIEGQDVMGVNRAIEGPYFPSQTIKDGSGRAKKVGDTVSDSMRTALKVKGDVSGMLKAQSIAQLLETRSYESAHGAAFSGYIRKLDHVLLGETPLKDKVRTTHGEQYAKWLTGYQKAVRRDSAQLGDVERWGQSLYNAARNVRLITPTVWAKQASAILLANGELDAKYFRPNMLSKKLTDEQVTALRKYAPEIIMRKRGFSLRETTEVATSRSKRMQAFMKPLLAVDYWAVERVYLWADAQVRAENPNLTGDALDMKIAQKTNDVINKTQPTYAPHTSAMILQEQGFIPRILTMYSTATNAMYNMTIGAVRDMQTGHGKRGVKKITAVVLSNAAAWGLGRLVTESFRGFSGGDDDETVGDVLIDMAVDQLGIFYGIRTIASSLMYKRFSVPVIEEATMILDAIVAIGENNERIRGYEVAYEETGDKGELENIEKSKSRNIGYIRQIAVGLANLTGIPLRAVEKYLVKPAVQYGFGEQAISDYNAFFGFGLEPSSNYEDLTKAINSGDSAKAMRYMEIVLNKGGNMDNYMKAKTGGAGLTAEQRIKAYRLWEDAMLKRTVDERIYNEEE